jgi:ectoine hydroxylase-related dioxygenase (phytanoyl-CoA dioxygenase family)
MKTVTGAQRQQLDESGFVVLEDFIPETFLAELRSRIEELFAEEGGQAGAEFKQEPGSRRLANLCDKGEVFRRAVAIPELLDYVGHVLAGDYKLSSLNVRTALPHNGLSQPLHADMGAIADERGYWVCNTVWMLDDFTTENGAIRVVPGSHKWNRLPQAALADPLARHPEEVLVTGRAGTVVVMNAHAWHGGTENRTSRERVAMHGFYARRDKPQQQYQKMLLRPEVQAALSERERWLLALDDPLNDEVTSKNTVTSGFLK